MTYRTSRRIDPAKSRCLSRLQSKVMTSNVIGAQSLHLRRAPECDVRSSRCSLCTYERPFLHEKRVYESTHSEEMRTEVSCKKIHGGFFVRSHSRFESVRCFCETVPSVFAMLFLRKQVCRSMCKKHREDREYSIRKSTECLDSSMGAYEKGVCKDRRNFCTKPISESPR